MNYHFQNFIKKNQKIIKIFGSEKKIILVDRGRFSNAIYAIYLAKIFNDKFNLDCIILSDKDNNSDIIKFYKSFGFNKFIKIFNYKKIIFLNIIVSIYIFFYTIILFFLSYLRGFQWMIDNLKFKDISIGDLIYDTYIRTDHKFLHPKFDIKLLNIFFKTLYRVHRIEKVFCENKIKSVIVGTYTYAYNEALSIRIAIKKKINVLEAGGNILFNYTSEVIKKGNDYSLVKKNFSKINKIAKKDVLNKFLIKRVNGKLDLKHTRNIDIKIQNNYKKFTKTKFFDKLKINKKEIKKIILFASHKFSESPHAKGKLIFRDYYDHFKKTLQFVANTDQKNNLWLFKPHPSSGEFHENNIVAREIKKINNSRILLCPKYLSSSELSKFCDLVITSRGTIGLEFASQGKPSLIAGNTVYSDRNLTLQPKNQKEYFDILKNLHEIKPLSPKNTLLAKKILYYLENFKLDMNNSDIALTLEEELKAKKDYFKYLNIKLSKKKFKEDIYFKQLKKNIDLLFNS
tara:strand:+ start:5126 stop:6667 length:1542 start_codon:yes stop_codon:yes gene_type:complete